MCINDYIDYDKKLLKCGVCGEWFKPISNNQFNNLVSKAKRLNRIFYCSNECKRIDKGSEKVICENCGKEFLLKKSAIKEHNYCSKECWYNKKRTNEPKQTKCLYCGKDFIVGKNNLGKYCSFNCCIDHKNKLLDELIESGVGTSHRKVKAYLLRHHTKCMNPNCKWNWDGNDNPILELHHIDGDHNNNTLENCLLLCPNCHSLTDNYKFKNAHSSTRKYRKKYYNDK